MRRLGTAVIAVLAVAGTGGGALLGAPGAAVATPSTAGATGPYVPVPATRVVDTRAGLGVAHAPVAARATVSPTITGHGGVPASGVAAVLVTVTVLTPRGGGYLTLFQAGTARPVTADVDFATGRTRAGTALVPVDSQGRIAVYNGSDAANDLVLDVSGYVAAAVADTPGSLHPLRAARIVDSRSGVEIAKRQIAGHTAITVPVSGHGGVPGAGGAAAAVLTVTAARAAASGWLTVYPAGSARPSAADVNFGPAQTIANLALAKLGTGGAVTIYNGSAKPADIVVDVSGYVGAGTSSAAGSTTAVVPNRILDTRTGNGAPAAIVGPRGTTVLTVTGRGGVPASGVAAVALTVTSTASTASGSVTAYADQTPRRTTTNLSHAAAVTTAGFAIVPVGTDGRIALYNASAGSTHLVAEVAGYVRGAAAPDTVAPGPVTGLVATPGTTSVALSWTDPPTTDLAGVTIRRADGTTAPATPTSGAAVAEVGRTTRSFTDAHRPANSTATYAVFAHDAAGNYATAATRTVRLTATQAFTGTVRSASTGVALAGVTVTATNQETDETPITDTTDAAGQYEIAGVQADTDYQLCFDPSALADQPVGGYARTCHDGPALYVAAGSIRAGVDVALGVGGTITGRVTDRSGDPIANVAVHLDAQYREVVARSGTDGTYRISGLPSGAVGLCFGGHDGTGGSGHYGYIDQCFRGYADRTDGGDTVPVLAGRTTAGIDAVLEARFAVRGVVVDGDLHPIAGAVVTQNSSGGSEDSDTPATSVTTDASGAYTIIGDLPGGDFNDPPNVCAHRAGASPYEQACVDLTRLDDQPDGSYLATTIVLGPPEHQFTIGGRVTDAAGHALSGVLVGPSGADDQFPAGVPTTRTGSDGRYTLRISFSADGLCLDATSATGPSPTGYSSRCVDADLAPDAITTVNVTLSAGAAIGGTVTDTAGAPLPGLTVEINANAAPYRQYTATTDSGGRYRATGLVAGSYYVRFDAGDTSVAYDGGPSPTGYLDQCYQASAGDDCTPVPLQAAATRTLDAHIARAGGASGTVTDAAGNPLRHASVFLVGARLVDQERTDLDGRWTAIRLPAGRYAVCVVPSYYTPVTPARYLRACYRGIDYEGNYDSSTYPVALTAGASTAGVDIVLPGVPVGSVRGTVTDPGGHPIAGIQVGSADTVTGTDGTFEIDGLSPGDQTVCTDSADGGGTSTGWLASCHGGDPGRSVTVTAGQTTSGVDITLRPAGAIRGTVTDTSTNPLPYVRVEVLSTTTGYEVGRTATAADGTFQIGGLDPGSYTVGYDPHGATESVADPYGIAPGWSGGASDQDDAASVGVTAGASTRANARLTPLAAIAGTVTNDAGGAFARDSVVVTGADGTTWVDYTAADGSYEIDALPAGTYTVCFNGGPYYQPATTQCWDERAGDDRPDPVTVQAGQRASDIDATLTRLSRVSVTVVDHTGYPISGATVQVQNTAGEPVGDAAETWIDGTAGVGNLLPGRLGLLITCPGYQDLAIPPRDLAPNSVVDFATVTLADA